MTVNKARKKEAEITEVIEKGGGSSCEASDEDTIRITFRVPSELFKKIEAARKAKRGRVPRNQWLIEQVARAFE